MPYNLAKIIDNEILAPGVFALRVKLATQVKPGQFYMLKAPNSATLLPRPISVCDYTDSLLTFVVAEVGRGTKELAALKQGDNLALTGALGNGFPVDEVEGKTALVGGGVGVAPMLLTAKTLQAKSLKVDGYFGFREETFLANELAESLDKISLSTESGRVGHKGYITEVFNPRGYNQVFCCGPLPMMREVVRLCSEADVPVYISLENKMACGIGGCLVCTCTNKSGKNIRACTDGPVFRGEEIDFEA